MASNRAQSNTNNVVNGSSQGSSNARHQSHADPTIGASSRRINVDTPQSMQQGHNTDRATGITSSSFLSQGVFENHVRDLIILQRDLTFQLFDLEILFDTSGRFRLSDADLEGRIGFFAHELPTRESGRVRRFWFRRFRDGANGFILGPYSREQVELEVRMLWTRRFGSF
ncbi:hypothetical protein BKA81DRAFT_405643 [Phyllosticta paracitricarpa]